MNAANRRMRPLCESRLRKLFAVLFITHLLHPIDDLAFERFLNCDVRHGCCRRSAVPMFQSRRKPDHITWTNLLYLAALALRPTATACDNERLTKRMRVPG